MTDETEAAVIAGHTTSAISQTKPPARHVKEE